MSIYAVGDVQGCHDELLILLDRIKFDPGQDRVWFVGDLVNRGPKSLATLRTIRSLGDAAVIVLGNHDLHLLAVASGISRTRHRDTFADVLTAPDRDELLDWLRHRPLIHTNGEFYLIHAGLPPQWNMDQAQNLAREAEEALQLNEGREFLDNMYGDEPKCWDNSLSGWERLRFITNCFTRLRYCRSDGRIDLKQKGPPGTQPKDLSPWFKIPDRRSLGAKILFGHWSTLKFHAHQGTWCLDTGCLWGGELTALRLNESLERVSVNNLQGGYQTPNRA